MVSRSRILLATPLLNGARYLRQALQSVERQTVMPCHYIVCDGGSTDDGPSIVHGSPAVEKLTLQRNNGGMYVALSEVFSDYGGEIMGWLNCDDFLFPWCLEAVDLFFRRNPECEWLTGIPAVADADGRLAWVSHVAPYYRRQWLARGWYSDTGLGTLQQECTFWRRSLYERVGGLNTSLRWGGDLDLWRRFAVAGAEVWQVGTVLAAFRQHGNNASAKNRELYLREAGAKRIVGGKILGYSYSFVRFLIERYWGKRRLRDLLLENV
jgi:glycosyltransferase involved in cell wall biosynthesis